jgi:hypothetical protein
MMIFKGLSARLTRLVLFSIAENYLSRSSLARPGLSSRPMQIFGARAMRPSARFASWRSLAILVRSRGKGSSSWGWKGSI